MNIIYCSSTLRFIEYSDDNLNTILRPAPLSADDASRVRLASYGDGTPTPAVISQQGC